MYPPEHVNPILRKNEGRAGPLPSEDRYLIVQRHNEISSKIFTGILSITRGESGGTGTGGGCNPPAVQSERFE